MSAMPRERKTKKLGEQTIVSLLGLPIKGATKVLAGALIALDAGFVVSASEKVGLIALGIAEETVDNTIGLDGSLFVKVRQGTFLVFDLGGADAIVQADVGKDLYLVDDQTVSKSDGGGKRSRAGHLMGVEPGGMVWVQCGIGL